MRVRVSRRIFLWVLFSVFLPVVVLGGSRDAGWNQMAGMGIHQRGMPPTSDRNDGLQPPRPAMTARLIESSRNLRDAHAPSLQRSRLEGVRAPSALHALAIMVEFADSCFYGRQDLFDGLPTSTQSNFYYAAHDSLYYSHLLQDVADYYDAVSGGRFAFNFAVHDSVITLSHAMAHYGDHPEDGEQPFLLAADAIEALQDGVDFSIFDTVILIHAGAGQETDVLRDSPEQIYSTYLGPDAFRWAVEDEVLEVPYILGGSSAQPDTIRHILILPETQFQDAHEGFSGQFGILGTYCFVLGMRLGMLSLSDFTPRGSPDSQGVGQFCLMGYGLFSAGGYVPAQPCVFNKVLMGWVDPVLVDPALSETGTLYPNVSSSQPPTVARIDLTGSEYYLLEYRLKDVNGNGIFSFGGDLNGNNIPDYFDTRNPDGSGRPLFFDPGTGERLFFDPETCVRERMTAAEWDFFLYYEDAYVPHMVKGGGSGTFIWHIDEGVIRDVFGLRQNLFNSDPGRKSVDLVEADGIQDLDSRQPSPFWLGSDGDSFRGEDNETFGPDTWPATLTNGGIRSGLVIDRISDVVVDSTHTFHSETDSQYTGILYADHMTFRCWREEPVAGNARLIASRDLPGVDMTGSHLLVAPLCGDLAAGEPVFVAAADSGRVYAWRADLSEWVDQDNDWSTFRPLAVGTDGGAERVSWHLPAAAGKFDPGRNGFQIVLTAAEGLYAFDQDGAPLAAGPAGSDHGLIASLPAVLPPVLLPLGPDASLEDRVIACVIAGPYAIPEHPWQMHFLDHAGLPACAPVALPGRPTASPVHADGVLYSVLEGSMQDGFLAAVSWPARSGEDPVLMWHVELDFIPGSSPPLVAPPFILVTSEHGRGQTLRLGEGVPEVLPPWDVMLKIEGAMGPGGAFCGPDVFCRASPGGTWQNGWPYRPRPAAATGAAQPLALVTDPGNAGASGRMYHLFAARDGRMYLLDSDGVVQPGWPLAGPADLHATPAVVHLSADRNDPELMLMAVATARQIQGLGRDLDDQIPHLDTHPVARLRSWIWPDVGPGLNVPAGGTMYGGSPWRGERVGDLAPPATDLTADLSATHVCYPQPLTTEVLRVRAMVARDTVARAVILNLQGERVRDTGEIRVLGNTPFDLEIDMRGVASGLYVCRLQADGMTSVRHVAVTR